MERVRPLRLCEAVLRCGLATTLKPFHNDYYNIGISYSPAKIVDFALVYKHDAGSNGDFGDQNGTIGGSAFAAGNNGAYNEIGLWGQLRW